MRFVSLAKRAAAVALLGITPVLGLAAIVRITVREDPRPTDFDAFWTSGRAVLHGVSPYPNVRSADQNAGAQFIDPRKAIAPARATLAAHGVDSSAITLSNGVVQVDRAAFERAGVNVDSLVRTIATRLRATPGIMRAETMREVARRDTTKDDVARRWMHMIPPDLDVALVVTPRPYWEWGWGEWPMATHGIPQSHDAHVPLIFYGPAFTAGR